MLRPLLLSSCLAFVVPLRAQEELRPGALFERVVWALERSWPDPDVRDETIPGLAESFRPDARAARDLDEERAVIGALLAELPASHLALYSRETFDALAAGIAGRRVPTFGFEVVRDGDRWRVDAVLDGGPAEAAGLLRGDVVTTLDGLPPRRSPRLDWRSDDAHLDDPERHGIRARDAGPLAVRVERDRATIEFRFEPREMSVGDASLHSARVVGAAGVGYVHLWMVQERGCASLLRRLFEDGVFRDVRTLVLDLRGRGGSAAEVARVVDLLRRLRDERGLRVFALIDRGTRSAKEVIAARLREESLATLVGERTAGAVLPADFADVGHGAVLMLPMATALRMTKEELEGVGVPPDVAVADAFTRDPILEAALELAQRPTSGARRAAAGQPRRRRSS